MWLALIAVGVLIWNPRLHERSTMLSAVLHLAMVLPFVTLAGLFIINDTSIHHVAAFGGEALPLKYRFAATWAAREGPLLMWLGWMSLISWIWRRPLQGEMNTDNGAYAWRLRWSHLMSLTLLLIAFSLDPFKNTPAFFIGSGLNPLLQTDLMVIHPPLIFLTYSLCLHLTAIAISAAYTSETSALGQRMLSIARPGLLIATLGIGLGGLWAYLILDWGGYWAWDPVETGSFLPWLALVMLVHLRTRPGKVDDNIWIGAGLAAGFFSLFATTVTRAGGVWASSVHTFVTSDSSTPPSDVFGRLMVLRDDAAATEVMTYVAWMLVIIGCWLAVQRTSSDDDPPSVSTSWPMSIPVWFALLGCLLLTGSNGEGLSWTFVPQLTFIIVLLAPLLANGFRRTYSEEAQDDGWKYPSLGPVPLDVVLILVVYAMTLDVFIAVATAVLFVPLYRSEHALGAWPWAAGGVMLGLGLAWSQLLTLPVAGFILLMFVFPWLVAPQETPEDTFNLMSRKGQLRMALWASVLLVSLYLVLTWVLLLASIDAVNFEAHELYGAPFLAALGAAFFLYTRRQDGTHHTLMLLGGATLLSVLGVLFAPDAFGRDSSTLVSEHLTRGHIVWISLPMLTLAAAPMIREVRVNIEKASKKGTWKRIPLGAHVVHLGLLLLLLGHLSTTVLVDRGSAEHRLSLVKDEVIFHDGLGFEFTDFILESNDLDVGDGFIGVNITVYEVDNGKVGASIGQVTPGTLRFDAQGVPRSEVATLTRLTGDVVFIFDGSQAGALMATAQGGNLENVELVRVTVYNLPHSHVVWLGWVTMMGGMALVTVAGAANEGRISNQDHDSSDDEE
ncbi:MAG: cytochrome c biogenesis protein CcsA [Candidatus Poseidonia sp.]|nr:cytochrome c biogenesis protein CcsA [Poseidonia sp.]